MQRTQTTLPSQPSSCLNRILLSSTYGFGSGLCPTMLLLPFLCGRPANSWSVQAVKRSSDSTKGPLLSRCLKPSNFNTAVIFWKIQNTDSISKGELGIQWFIWERTSPLHFYKGSPPKFLPDLQQTSGVLPSTCGNGADQPGWLLSPPFRRWFACPTLTHMIVSIDWDYDGPQQPPDAALHWRMQGERRSLRFRQNQETCRCRWIPAFPARSFKQIRSSSC